MKTFAIGLLILSAISGLWGTAILTAKGRPPQWANWHWKIGPIEAHFNEYAFWLGIIRFTPLPFWAIVRG